MIRENEISISVIRDSLFFSSVNRAKYSDIEIHFRLQNSIKMDLIAVVRFLGVVFVHSDQHARAKVFFFNYLHFYAIF